MLKMVFDDGFFHADIHPGNFFIEPNGRFGLIDFGMVGTVDERTRDHLVQVLLAITGQDAYRLVDAFLGLGVAQQQINRTGLRQDLAHLLASYNGRPLGELALGPLLTDTLAIIRRYRLQLPVDLALLLKTLVMTEGLATQLDPTFQLTTALTPYAQRLLLRQYSPLLWARRSCQASLDMAYLSAELPQQVRRLIDALEGGTLHIGMHPSGVEPLLGRVERLANRIVLGILTAAFIIGLAILMSVYHPPGWQQWAGVVFTVGFVIAVALGAYLARTILRSGRM